VSETEAPFTLLLVDDEANILSSLRRLFRPQGYRVFTAEGGPAGLAVLEKESVDLVISDMRMPEMSGAQFLGETRKHWPEMIRILLTGYADLASTIEAINSGQIHRYLSKPWNDEEVVAVVAQALERKALERENRRLGSVVERQNEELRALNAGLEAKVEERTREVAAAHEKLKAGFINAIKTFSNLMELRRGASARRWRCRPRRRKTSSSPRCSTTSASSASPTRSSPSPSTRSAPTSATNTSSTRPRGPRC